MPNENSLFDVIATTNGSLTGFGNTVSINDSGLVALIGKYGTVQDLLVGDGTSPLKNLSSNFDLNTSFALGVEINNNNEVVAVDRQSNGISGVRLWDADQPGTFTKNIATSKFLATNTFQDRDIDFDTIYPFPGLNNKSSEGQPIFAVVAKGESPKVSLATPTYTTDLFGARVFKKAIMATGQVKAAIADDGTIVVRDPLSKIVLQDYQLNLTGVVASDTKGFTTVGMAPEISDDSNAVVFYGNYNGTGTNITPGLQSGAGIFVSITTDTGRVIKRIAGVAGNGVLDPGEKFTDNNNNGVFDSGVDTDTGLIGGFAPDEKLGVTFNKTPDGGYGNVAYLGTDSAGKEALFSSQFNLSSSSSEPIITTKLVAKVGQPAGEVSSQLTGNIQDLNIYDPINDKGQIAFWVKTDAAQEAVVRANPILKPVLLVPGISATFPKGNFKDWIMNRGVQPDTLRADPLGLLWDDLVETLKRAGYVEGVNLFVATTDWRLNPGPVDGVFDGKIHRSVEELMDNKYEYSVDQLAFWLKKAVEGWRSQFKGIPDANIPELTDVDIIAHSAGGLTTRAYIQDEDAYGKKFTTIAGKDINLPKVDNFITLGVPYRGGTTAWNLLHNDFDGAPFTTFLGQILRVAYKKVKDNNEVIKLSGSTSISEGAINKSLLEGLSLNGFIEKYVPSLKSLLATYKFVDVIADNPSQDLKRAEYLGLDEANKFLVDLNYGYDSEQNQEFVDPTLFAKSLSATATGNITVAYNAATKTLTLNGTDTIANYEQVLKSVKYTNTKANPNLTPRQIEFVVNDGASFNNLSPTATTTVIFSLNRSGTTGNDTLIGADGNDTLKGLEGNDRLEGKAGNDSLDGGTGNDNMIGDAGNDVYVVDSTSDVVSETPTTAGEIDTVQSSVTHTLGANLENLALTGTAAINANGNALANKITGNAANNVLNGSTGADSLYSGFFYTEVDGIAGYSAGDTLLTNGNDTYIVDNAGDKVKESGTTATTEVDTVKSSVTFTLTNPTVADPNIALSRVENLELTGTGAINATGNALNNKITGNIAANTLDGAAGNDTLTGGQSSDRFLYNTNTAFTSSAVGIDTITDFAVGSDKILLDKTTFTALQSVAGNGFSVVSDFAIVSADSLAGASSGLIVYSSASDNLFYNPDGTTAGLASGGQFATLSGIASLNASDFEIQA
jgi:Ca2+-binding RTX toxin-like protein